MAKDSRADRGGATIDDAMPCKRVLVLAALCCGAARAWRLSRRRLLRAVPVAAGLALPRREARALPVQGEEPTRDKQLEELSGLLERLNEAEQSQREEAARRSRVNDATASLQAELPATATKVTPRGTCWYELNGEWSRIEGAEGCQSVDSVSGRIPGQRRGEKPAARR